jgi:hypothetical protein
VSSLPPPATTRARPFRGFSWRRLRALASNTLTQLLRMKTLYFLIVFGLALLVVGFVIPAPPVGVGMATFGGEQELRLLKSVALGAMSWFSVIVAIAGTAVLLPRDLEDRTLYTILSKPVPRFEYLLGKLCGVLLLLVLTLAVMDAFCCLALWLKQNSLVAQEIAYWERKGEVGPEKLAEIHRLYDRFGLDWNFQAPVLGIFFQAAIMASLALLISTFASSTLFTILAGLGFLIIGQGQELAREYLFRDMIPAAQRLISVIIALALPDLRQFNVIDETVAGQQVPAWFLWRMTGMAVFYLAFYNLLAWFTFSDKEL